MSSENKILSRELKHSNPTPAFSGASAWISRFSLDPCLAHQLGGIIRFIRRQTGQVFIREGDKADRLYLIVEGAVRVATVLPNGRRQIIGFALPGDPIGLSIEADQYPYDVEAVVQTYAIALPWTALDRASVEHPGLARWLEALARQELHRAYDHIRLLGRPSTRERVALFLLFLAKRQVDAGVEPTSVYLPVSRQDIADHLGVCPETVSRIITDLRTEGVLVPLRKGFATSIAPELLAHAAGLTSPDYARGKENAMQNHDKSMTSHSSKKRCTDDFLS
jgi:CRP/FNR family transcriptional regulator, anaerobic regulatory protein